MDPAQPEPAHSDLKKEIEIERESLLERIQEGLELPMLVLAFVWLALFVVEVIWGLSPFVEILGYVIWGVFIVEFLIGITLAPRKGTYLKKNWLKTISLVAPALRVFRLFTVLRVARLSRVAGMSRGLRLLRVVASVNRGMRALGRMMRRRGLGYILTLTLIVALVGSAGMYSFELEAPGGPGFTSYGEALWWTIMLLVTIGSEYWPVTPAGRALSFFLALYSFGIFGYITATLATFFVGRDADRDDSELASARSVEELRKEVVLLREELEKQRES